MAESEPGKHNKGKALVKKTSRKQIQNIEMKVREVERKCSNCKNKRQEPQTDSTTSSTKKQRSSHKEGCLEQRKEEKEEGKEEGISFIGYYCKRCGQRFLLRKWKGNKNKNTNTERQPKTACPCTENLFPELQAFELTGYYCSSYKQEWLLEGCATHSQKVEDGICLHSHRQCEEEIKKEGPVEVIGYLCPDCDTMRPFKEWNVDITPHHENTIRDHHARTGCHATFQKYEEHAQVRSYSCTGCNKELLFKEWYGNPIPETENTLRDHHHRSGCRGEIRPMAHGDHGIIIGYFCSCCKKEWLLKRWNSNPAPDINFIPVDHHIIPIFCCLELSDTGSYVKWKNVKGGDGLNEGDHVAWQRCFGYWHHAIVEEVKDDGSLKVIEWNISCKGIGITQSQQKEFHSCNVCSCMYKAVYPPEVIEQNPSDLVLSRARARLNDEKYSLFSDNCEHFATYCKTGCHQSPQLFQLNLHIHGWCRRLLASLIHIVLIAFISELTENAIDSVKDVIGITVLIVTEFIYCIIVMCAICIVDTRKTNFTQKQLPERSCPYCCAYIKALLQTAFLLGFAIFFAYYVKKFVVKEYWTDISKFLVEVALVIFGAGVGNIVGFWLQCCLGSCCTGTCRSSHGEYIPVPGTNKATHNTNGAGPSNRNITENAALV